MPEGIDADAADATDGADELAEPRRRRPVLPWLIAVVVLALVVGGIRLVRGDGGQHPAARASTTAPAISTSTATSTAPATSTPAPATSADSSTSGIDDDYARATTTQDLRAALTTAACAHRCTLHPLTGAALARAAAGFAGLHPVAAGVVRRTGTGPFVAAVAGYDDGGTLVQLSAERVQLPADGVRVTDTRDGTERTEVLSIIRDGRRLTAMLTVPAGAPPTDAAAAWLRTTTLPD